MKYHTVIFKKDELNYNSSQHMDDFTDTMNEKKPDIKMFL